VADRAGVVNVSPINGLTALITRAEAERALDQLEDEGGDVTFESLSGAAETGKLFPVPQLAGILLERAIDWWA
jgi:hypothetical protein